MKTVSTTIIAFLFAATINYETTLIDIPDTIQSYDSHICTINEQFPTAPVDSNDGCGS